MAWERVSTRGVVPDDPVGETVAAALGDVLVGAAVRLVYGPDDGPPLTLPDRRPGTAAALGTGPEGWRLGIVVQLTERVARLVPAEGGTLLAELLDTLPAAAARSVDRYRHGSDTRRVGPALRRAMRDTLASEVLGGFLEARVDTSPGADLVAEIVEYLIELSGTRVEAHDLTHGVVVADILHDVPRLQFRYPTDVRAAKRAPLLFDGQRSVLVVDPEGRARTELQRHRFERLVPGAAPQARAVDGWTASGSLVADTTRALGGIGFFGRADRGIWTFVDGKPLLVRRAEHWTAFPLELTASIAELIGGGDVAAVVARTALMVSAGTGGAILAIVDDAADLDGVVSVKDRFDLRDQIDRAAMRPETRLHHLIDADDLDEQALARLATLDGATVVDRDGQLLAYGAVVTSTDSQAEGARTAAARTLSETAAVVLKVSADGDITVFRKGAVVTTLLGRPPTLQRRSS